MLRRILNLLRPESAGDLFEESKQHSHLWMLRQILSALLPSGRPFAAYSSDLRYGARTLAKNPGFATIAIGAIALGIGVNTGIFTILNGVALKRLPAPGSDRLISVYQQIEGISFNVHGAPNLIATSDYETYRDQSHVFSGLAAYQPFLELTLAGDRPRKIFGQLTSCNYFEVVNEPPAIGRALNADDCRKPGEGAVMVISDALWRSDFGTDPAIAGKRVVLNRKPFTIVGVAKPGFGGTEIIPASFWAPITMQPALESIDVYSGEWAWLAVIGRAKPDLSVDQVRADLNVLAAGIDRKTPHRKTTLDIATATLISLPEERQMVNLAGGIVLAAVGMVLLIACANVANLLLARGASRQHEIGIRLSVGATRWRLVRQLLTESMLIAIAGGLLGSAIAVWTFQSIAHFVVSYIPVPEPIPGFQLNLAPDWRVLTYSLALTLITGIVFGLAPALRASRPLAKMKSAGFLRNALVAIQVAVCMVLLIAAGLLLRGLWAAQTIDPGFQTKNVASVRFFLREEGYSEERAAVFQRRFRDRIGSLAGIERIAEAGATPLGTDHFGTGVVLRGESRSPRSVSYNTISPEFFSIVGIPIVRGRNFTEDEAAHGAPVVIVTESTARRFWPGKDPLGKSMSRNKIEMQVIGVAKDAQVSSMGRSDNSFIYLPAGPEVQDHTQWVLRYAGGFAPLADSIRAAVRSLDPDLVIQVAPLEKNLEFSRSGSRVVAVLAGSLGALALLLASMGIYGVVSFAVSRRLREIGIRMALGADRSAVRRLVLAQAMRPVGIGALCGIALCAGVSRVLSSLLFGIGAHDPVAFVAVPVLLIAVALAASYLPARRATNVDPASTLRHE